VKSSVQLSFFWQGLAMLFITLKLTGVIDWSWLWVLAPLWGGVALVFVGMVIAGIVIAVSKK
jgi:hypothetical protein